MYIIFFIIFTSQSAILKFDILFLKRLNTAFLINHFQATDLLKKAEGVVELTVCNPNVDPEEEEKKKQQEGSKSGLDAQKTPQKGKFDN